MSQERIDLLYLAHNRREFTELTLRTMALGTDFSLVRSLTIYDDNSVDGTRQAVARFASDFRCCPVHLEFGFWGSPVAIMNDYLKRREPGPMFAKIDSDTMLPPGWLGECLSVMERYPRLELLGIEAMHPVGGAPRRAAAAEHIGGIGLFRTSAWRLRPQAPMIPNGRLGFTHWQSHNGVAVAWLQPSIPVCLLDRMPLEPWKRLSEQYVAAGWQRPWDLYDDSCADLWRWWA